jgi:HSP20 family molecular chaperone IbpA
MLHLHPSFIYLNPKKSLACPATGKLNKERKDFYFGQDAFEAKLDVRDFKEHEISVRTDGQTITVEAEHEERDDSFSTVSRKLVRKFYLPENERYDTDHLTAKLSYGFLMLMAPTTKAKESVPKPVPIKNN